MSSHIKKKWRGVGFKRIGREPREKVFALSWQKLNERPGCYATLDYVLDTEGRHRPPESTARDREVACTVIQWLGTPIGYQWLRKTLAEFEKEWSTP